jgi:hypothetical protein
LVARLWYPFVAGAARFCQLGVCVYMLKHTEEGRGCAAQQLVK